MEEEELYIFLNSASSRSRTQNKANRKKSCYTENTYFFQLYSNAYTYTHRVYALILAAINSLFEF